MLKLILNTKYEKNRHSGLARSIGFFTSFIFRCTFYQRFPWSPLTFKRNFVTKEKQDNLVNKFRLIMLPIYLILRKVGYSTVPCLLSKVVKWIAELIYNNTNDYFIRINWFQYFFLERRRIGKGLCSKTPSTYECQNLPSSCLFLSDHHYYSIYFVSFWNLLNKFVLKILQRVYF